MKICKHTHSKRTRLEFSSWEIYNMRMKMKTICGVDEMKLLLQSSALSLPPPQKTSHNLTSSSYYHSILFNLPPPSPANISWLFHSVFFASREWVQLSFSFLSGGRLFFLRLRLYCLSFLSCTPPRWEWRHESDRAWALYLDSIMPSTHYMSSHCCFSFSFFSLLSLFHIIFISQMEPKQGWQFCSSLPATTASSSSSFPQKTRNNDKCHENCVNVLW